MMAATLRKCPPLCLGISVLKLLLGRLRFPKPYLGETVKMEDGQEFTVFRHISAAPFPKEGEGMSVFIVNFKFARLSHRGNRIASIIPMLLIAGFPGFQAKMYGVNKKNGYWQGMYQWKSRESLEEYKKSFVFKTMNRRAIQGSINSFELHDTRMIDFIESNKT
jgi:hypothetical protein